MKLNSMPKDTAAELLEFLAENESLESVRKILDGSIKITEVRSLFRELADGLRREAAEEAGDFNFNSQKERSLSKGTKEIISYLSPREERTLLSAFGLIDKK